MSVEFDLQRAIYQALTAAGLRVYDSAPQASDAGSAATYPYVEIGTIFMEMWDTADKVGFDFVARIHTRSRSAGMAETKGIQGTIYGALHRATLPVAGHNMVLMHRLRSDVMRASDGAFHGVCEYRGLLAKT